MRFCTLLRHITEVDVMPAFAPTVVLLFAPVPTPGAGCCDAVRRERGLRHKLGLVKKSGRSAGRLRGSCEVS